MKLGNLIHAVFRLIVKFYPELLECHHIINPKIYSALSTEQYNRIIGIIYET